MNSDKRRLAAIMFTDIVGFSAKSQQDEQEALKQLYKHQEMVRAIYPHYNGREIKTIGDAFMLEFGSTISAVECAVQIQKEFSEHNGTSDENENIFLRIGIHVGEVMERDGDIYGDAVNISSRLEPLAYPGGVCISEDVERQIRNKVDVQVEKMQKQELKNIKLPMEVYQILLYAKPEAALPKPDSNKLAVLPFQNFSPERDTDYFSDGLTEELTMHLSSIKELKIVSRTTCMQYKNAQKDLRTIGSELNARYIVEGSVRRHGDDLRITAQLIDVNTDSHLWAESYRGNMSDVFDIQENVSKKILEALRVTLSPAEQVALQRRSTTDSKAFDLTLHARELLYKRTKSYLLAAADLFNKALELDPRYAAAYAGLGEVYSIFYEWHDKNPKWLEKAMEASLKALMYDSNSAEAYAAMGLVYYHKELNDEALEAIEKAIHIDPNSFFAYWLLGRIYRMIDREEDAIVQFKKVLELNPDFHSVYGDLQMSYERIGDRENLEDTIDQALEFYPSYILMHPDDARAIIYHAFVLQYRGKDVEAMAQMERAIELSPNDAVMLYNAACFYATLGEKDKAVDHLKAAIQKGYEFYEYIKRDPDLDSIREEAGYKELMKGH